MAPILKSFLLSTFVIFSVSMHNAQSTTENTKNSSAFDGLELRSIGPAFMSGRIADIAIHPKNESIWYVAVGSGGVWKTVNAGTTWSPVFDNENSYSIGAVTIDPNNYNTIWVGTGEDVGGRHVAFGDGIYKSENGGMTWTNMGLKKSQHISRVIVHPENSNTIWVTAQGPLWNKGGERGLYKSTDGGKTWKKTLGNDQWTGATDLVYDPRNPDVMYAATWDRHRTVAAYMGGGPGTGLHKSTDGGETWEKLVTGLPKTAMGKIGLAISPQNSDVLYAAIELERRTGAVYKSVDGGESWQKQSNTVSGGTGPHYYQELFASPHQKDRLYLMDNTMQISEDGGKTFYRMNRKNKHGDNHAIAFKKHDPNYILVGTDGGLYESFDLTKTWKYVDNLPVTQFYKVAVDDAKPFYNIYGGTQDNNTQGGPSRTDNLQGIQNSDWRIILNADGHQPATEPGNPNIVYAERQEGKLSRIDMSTGEVVDIQPQPAPNENHERYNWDAPILVSPHNPTTIYFASQRVWKSENRGDKWEAISNDLTKNQERIVLPIMGKKQSWDAAWDVYAMSNYNTITSLAESPITKGLLYAGTDDGRINISENDGETWRTLDVGKLPGVPATAFVNDIKADLHEANTVYVALDNHKYGDFNPYLYKSTNKGKSWVSITNNLPKQHLVWRLVQDHINPNLLFIGTEFGLFFSINSGKEWHQLKGNMPTIALRDLAIQKRENDLVAASFGRGFYVLDDYSPLREVTPTELDKPSKLFPVKDALWYIPRSHLSFKKDMGSQGDSHYAAPNPKFGAVFTYYLKEAPKTKEQLRKNKEEKQKQADIPFPGWEALEAEIVETTPQLIFVISNASGDVIRSITCNPKQGINRLSWDLRYGRLTPITLDTKKDKTSKKGLLVAPGAYQVTMFLSQDGTIQKLSEAVPFNVIPLHKKTFNKDHKESTYRFWRAYESTMKDKLKFDLQLAKSKKQVDAIYSAILNSNMSPETVFTDLNAAKKQLDLLNSSYTGNPAKKEIDEKQPLTVKDRMDRIYRGIDRSTYGPTAFHENQLSIVNDELREAQSKLNEIQSQLNNIITRLKATNAPYIEE